MVRKSPTEGTRGRTQEFFASEVAKGCFAVSTNMGKLAKPQKSKKHKKVKAVDPFYHGERKKLLDK